jgi:hypothetical protein
MSASSHAPRSVPASRRPRRLRVAVLVTVVAAWNLGCTFHVDLGSCSRGGSSGASQVTETREVSGFSAIDLRAPGQVVVTVGDHEALTIEAADNVLPRISSTVRDGVLVLEWTAGSVICTTRPVVYRVTAKELNALSVSGSGTIEAPGLTELNALTVNGSGTIEAPGLSVSRLRASVAGSGDIRVPHLTAEELETTASGSGTVEASGTATRLTLTKNGSGGFKGRDLAVRDARVTSQGSGDAAVRVSDSLDVELTGSGSVRYLGSPRVQSKVTGSGKVHSF